MSKARHLLIPGIALLLVACQKPSVPADQREAPPGFEQLRAEGDARLAERDYERAVLAYRNALVYDPASLAVRYSLGAALAHLGRREEAIAAFTWVVEQGKPALKEVQIARQWLAEAGVWSRPAAESASRGRSDIADVASYGALMGKTEWKLDPGQSTPMVQILLDGDDPVTRGRRYWAKVRLNEPYQISRVVPGRYRVIAQVGPIRLWETTADIKEGQPTVLALTRATSVAPRSALSTAS